MSDEMDDPIYVEIVKARVKLLFDKPFFGQLSSRLLLVLTDDDSWCKTCSTDGRKLYVNRNFVKSLSKPQLLFMIGHEVLHCCMDHLGRRAGRDPKLWSMATDYMVNYVLKQEGVGEMPPDGLYDPKYNDEMSAEEIYQDLLKNSVTIKMPLDQHVDSMGSGDGDGDGDGESVEITVTGQDGPPRLTEEDLATLRNEIRSQMIQAAQSCKPGQVPAGIKRLIADLTEPKLDWRELLDSHIRSSQKDDYTFQRMSRRTWGSGCILPSQDYMDTIDVAVNIDNSGSMTDDMIRDILSEVKGIMTTFRDFKLSVATWDTQVYGYTEFTPENIGDIDTYQPQGGGGTQPSCMWNFYKENGIEPERIVCFTDGYVGDDWGDPDYAPTLWVIHGTDSIVASHGITCYYEDK